MKAFGFLILLAVLFASDYALAAPCPCDTLELTDGISGEDIIRLLCPDGSLGEGTVYSLNPGFVEISSDSFDYEVSTDPAVCSIAGLNFDEVLKLTDQEAEGCRANLIAACRLLTNPIPTLSEWGMISMAGVLGIIGLIVAARRRKAAA